MTVDEIRDLLGLKDPDAPETVGTPAPEAGAAAPETGSPEGGDSPAPGDGAADA